MCWVFVGNQRGGGQEDLASLDITWETVLYTVCVFGIASAAVVRSNGVSSPFQSLRVLFLLTVCATRILPRDYVAPVEEILPRGGGEGVEAVVSMKQLTHCKGKIIPDDQRKLGLQ
jgi:hypothetical protein